MIDYIIKKLLLCQTNNISKTQSFQTEHKTSRDSIEMEGNIDIF